MNEKVLEILNYMVILRTFEDKPQSVNAIKKAITNIEALDRNLKKTIKAGDIPGIGAGIATYIRCILTNKKERTGIEDLDNLKSKEFKKIKEVSEMIKLPRVGVATALAKYKKGYDAKKLAKELGVTKSDVRRIPIKLVAKFEKKFRKLVNKLNDKKDVDLQFEIVGSARRNKIDGEYNFDQNAKVTTCGDIDVILWSETLDRRHLTKYMNKLIEKLDIVETLSHGDIKFQGSINLNSEFPKARIDISIVEEIKNLAAVLLHTTGPAAFNVRCSLIAIEKGWKLGEAGLIDNNGKVIKTMSERAIFKKIGLPYLEPHER